MNIGILLAALGVGAVALLSRKKAQAGDQAFMNQVYGPSTPALETPPAKARPQTEKWTTGMARRQAEERAKKPRAEKSVVLLGDGVIGPSLLKALHARGFSVDMNSNFGWNDYMDMYSNFGWNDDRSQAWWKALLGRIKASNPDNMILLVAGSTEWDKAERFHMWGALVGSDLMRLDPSRKKRPPVLVLAAPGTERALRETPYPVLLSSRDKYGTYTPTRGELAVMLPKFKV